MQRMQREIPTLGQISSISNVQGEHCGCSGIPETLARNSARQTSLTYHVSHPTRVDAVRFQTCKTFECLNHLNV